MAETNYFAELNAIDVNEHTDKKGNLTYLSWAWAWAELKKKHPTANYKIYENAEGWNYHTDGRTAWVKVSVTVEGIEHIEMLPVMDFKNKSIQLNAITSFEVNKAIQRACTKAIARHGIGLYIYAGEDLPEESDGQNEYAAPKASAKQNSKAKPASDLAAKAEQSGIAETVKEYRCEACHKPYSEVKGKDGKIYNAGQVYHIMQSHNTDKISRCEACAKALGLYK